MNMTKIKSLFKLFSGNECTAEIEPIIDIAVIEVQKLLLENADTSDTRLDFLCASMANFRYYQALASSDRSLYTYGGKVLNDHDGKILSFAEGLLKGYFQLCADLLKDSGFVFFGVVQGVEDV